jgi:vancomycin resistance protein YoaR
MQEDKQKSFFLKWLFFISAIFLLLVLVTFVSLLIIQNIYQDKIYPHISINNLPVGKLTVNQAKELINKQLDQINQDGIIFNYNDTQTTIMPMISSAEGDIAYQVISFNSDVAINNAFGFGHSGKMLVDLKQLIRALLTKQNIVIPFNINEPEIKKNLINSFTEFNQPAENAKLIYSINNDGVITFSVQKEKYGQTLNFTKGLEDLKLRLATLDKKPIVLEKTNDQPTIFAEETLNIDALAQKILALAPLNLQYKDNYWPVDKETFAGWLNLKLSQAENSAYKIIIGLDNVIVKNYLNDNLVKQIDQEPIDAKFEMKNERITEFQASQDGQKLNIDASFNALEQAIIYNATSTAALIVEENKSNVNTANLNNLGIKEIIGIGKSNFSGSPKNRRLNIRTGATKLNGVLIKPGEEFSLVKTLGKIDASTGYLPELVIKENKTTPEFGGGLCQIGTTMFRTALATGLPITMRRNHSYRVSYYEPAGTDATIYDPMPDLRFINDTENYILIQARIENNELYFDFWGTKDGRIIEQTKPIITNIVKPGPTKLIETLDLKPGERKCTEKAHNGADASFRYKVTYLNSEIKEKTFSSHYVPWREVCLVGVEKLSIDNVNPNSTSTPSSTDNINPNTPN